MQSFVELKNYIENKIPTIRVLKLPNSHPLREFGEYITLDNRRLFCFRMVVGENSNFTIPVIVLSYEEMERSARLKGRKHELDRKLTTVNNGGIPFVRGVRG